MGASGFSVKLRFQRCICDIYNGGHHQWSESRLSCGTKSELLRLHKNGDAYPSNIINPHPLPPLRIFGLYGAISYRGQNSEHWQIEGSEMHEASCR